MLFCLQSSLQGFNLNDFISTRITMSSSNNFNITLLHDIDRFSIILFTSFFIYNSLDDKDSSITDSKSCDLKKSSK
jgi:hypothetical protein